jgi:phage terminase large subunit-like protein
MVFTLDKEDDYLDESCWAKSNPSIGDAMSIEWLRAEFRQAQNFSSELNNFLTKNLNLWLGGVETWLERNLLDSNDGRDLNEEEIDEGIIYLGLDLGMVNDISALAQVTMFGDERIHVKMRYYMSQQAYQKFIGMGIPFDAWVKQGISINVNPGRVTDTRVIVKDIVDIVEALDVDKIGFDRWSTNEIVAQLDDMGISVEGVGQGYKTHTEVVSFIERAMYEERMCLVEDDCLKWMFSNVVLDQDPSGNRKLNKAKADNKIDGVSALFNALWYYTQVDQGNNDYSGIRSISIG